MKKCLWALPIIAVSLFSQQSLYAIEGLSIKPEGTNIVLSWPSTQWANYIVQYRTTVDSTTTWETLTNCIEADGTGTTHFTHFGVIPPPSPSSGTGGGGGTNEIPPFELLAMGSNESLASGSDNSDLYPPLPPMPWDTSTWTVEQSQETSSMEMTTSDVTTTNSGPTCGFYRVLQVPSFQNDVSQYLFDGATFLPIDFGGYLDSVQNLEVLLNGEPTTYSEFMPYDYNGQTYWGVGIYFDRIPSGTYQLQLRCTLAANDFVGEDSTFLVLSNNVASVTVDNSISFPNWDDLITSTNYTFKAQSKSQDADWYFDIYDVGGYFIAEGSGHTSDGVIEWTWDLKDWQGYLRDDLDYDPYFDTYLTIEGSSQARVSGMAAASKTVLTPPAMLDFPKVGGWVFAYMDNYYSESGSLTGFQQEYLDSVNQLRGAPSLKNYPSIGVPLAFGTNHTQLERNNSYSYLAGNLYNAQNRNFFYFGHGNATTIGCDFHTYDTNGTANGGAFSGSSSKAYLTSAWVRENITFNRYGGSRPYRFVFLAGCNTANGDWPDAFGIPKTEYTTTDWYSSTNNTRHVRPSAFIGWSAETGGQGWGSNQGKWAFYKNFYSTWSVTYYSSLSDAIDQAASTASWPPADKRQFLKKFGYTGLKFTDYNTK